MKIYLVQSIECYDGRNVYSRFGVFSTKEKAEQTIGVLMHRAEYEFGYDFIGEVNNWENYRNVEFRFSKGNDYTLYVLSEINTTMLQ